MTILTDEKFSFASKALPKETFSVIKFAGSEALGKCYDFSILLASERMDVDLEEVLASPAVFTIHRDQDDVYFNGVLKSFEQRHSYGGYFFYHADLTPRLHLLSRTVENRIFLDMTLPDILTEVLKAGGLEENDFELRLQGDYQPWEYVCQYKETYLDFISRWMERDGIYYYFEQSADKEKLILTDSKLSHAPRPHGDKVAYTMPSGLDGARYQEVVQTFACSQKPVPANVILKDYNYRTPSLELTGRAKASDHGDGDVYIYGEHFRTPEEGDRLASIRAEEFLCRERQFLGEGRVPYIQPGFSFELAGHYRPDYDGQYVTTEVHHEGSQTEYLAPSLRPAFEKEKIELAYYNLFKAIPADLQYRPKRETGKSRFRGGMNATIDAAGSGQYAELDDMGRYKVILPFDASGRKDGKASTWLRMMQPYAGGGQGMHFPLHKGAEVLLTFIDGDPDRPIIAGAAPNPDYPSPVTAENQTQCRLTTAGGSKLHIEDKQGEERIMASAPTADSSMLVGAVDSNPSPTGTAPGEAFYAYPYSPPPRPQKVVDDPDDIKFSDEAREWSFLNREKDGITLATTQGFDLKAGTYNSVVMGEETSLTAGVYAKTNVGEFTYLHLGTDLSIFIGGKTDVKTGWHWQTLESVAHMRWFHRKLSLAEQIVQEETTQLQADVTRVIGDCKQAVGEANRARGSLKKATGQANKAVGQLTKAHGKVDKVVGSLEDACGEANKAKIEMVEVFGEATQAAGDCDEAAAQQNRLNGEVIGSLAAVTEITALKARASGVDSK